MTANIRSSLLVFLSAASLIAAAEDGFRSMFNGRDLSGWVDCNVAPESFVARDGMDGLAQARAKSPDLVILDLMRRFI